MSKGAVEKGEIHNVFEAFGYEEASGRKGCFFIVGFIVWIAEALSQGVTISELREDLKNGRELHQSKARQERFKSN